MLPVDEQAEFDAQSQQPGQEREEEDGMGLDEDEVARCFVQNLLPMPLGE